MMPEDRDDRENRIKLDILESLSRSQKALARMIEHIAEVTTDSEALRRRLLENIPALTAYQESIAAHLTGWRVRRRKKGNPAPPWLNRQAEVAPSKKRN